MLYCWVFKGKLRLLFWRQDNGRYLENCISNEEEVSWKKLTESRENSKTGQGNLIWQKETSKRWRFLYARKINFKRSRDKIAMLQLKEETTSKSGICGSIFRWSSEEERREDALAPGADEGRDKLRKAVVRSKYPATHRYPNGGTRPGRSRSL